VKGNNILAPTLVFWDACYRWDLRSKYFSQILILLPCRPIPFSVPNMIITVYLHLLVIKIIYHLKDLEGWQFLVKTHPSNHKIYLWILSLYGKESVNPILLNNFSYYLCVVSSLSFYVNKEGIFYNFFFLLLT
jgi:hypothetical protein